MRFLENGLNQLESVSFGTREMASLSAGNAFLLREKPPVVHLGQRIKYSCIAASAQHLACG